MTRQLSATYSQL